MGSVKYDDDEQIIATNDDNKDLLGDSLYGVASTIPLKFNNEPKVPIQDTNYKLLISLMAGKRINTMNKNSSGADIVIVIDISESMEHRKFEQMKQALLFLIRKFTPSERISIVTFASNPERKFNLRQMTRNFREEIDVLVRNLSINKGGNTDIVLGLKEGLRILDERKYFSGRCGGVILMSDGMQMDKENRDPIMVVVDRFPVFTFGFGTQGEYNAQVLNEIAKNSKGGTFSVANPGNLSIVFSQCLGSLLSAHVQDVKLILRPLSDKVNKREKVESKIIKVYAGKYPQIRDESTGELTILFGNLYLREMHTLLVHLFLPAVTEEVDLDALEITCTYRGESGDLTSTNPALFRVTRTNTPDTKQIHADDTDILHKLILDMMNEAIYNLEEARNKAVEAQSLLDEFDFKKPNPVIEPLKHDVNELVKYLPTEERYINNGRRAITSYYGTTSRTPKLMVRSSSSMQQHPLLAMNMRSPLMVSKTFKEASIISPTLLRFSLAC